MKKGALLISQINSGGAEHVVSRLTYILKNEYDLDLIIFENMGGHYPIASKLINMDIKAESKLIKKIIIFFKRVRTLKRLINLNKYEFVLSFLDTPNLVNIISKTNDCKVIVSIRNYSELENKKQVLGNLLNLMIKRLYNKADAIISVTDLIANNYIKNYNIPSEKIFTIYNPYDIKEIQTLGLEQTEFINCSNKEKFKFVSMGRQMYQKGFWHLIKSFSLVLEKIPNSILIIIGEDYQQGKVEKLIKEMNLQEKIILTGQLKNPYAVISKCDCYVLSSLYEGFPNSMVEAMACKIPVIASDCKSGPREILFDKPNFKDEYTQGVEADYGILVPCLEFEENWDKNFITQGEKELSYAMINVIKNTNLRTKLKIKSEIRSKYFNYNLCRERYCDVINKLINKKKR